MKNENKEKWAKIKKKKNNNKNFKDTIPNPDQQYQCAIGIQILEVTSQNRRNKGLQGNPHYTAPRYKL